MGALAMTALDLMILAGVNFALDHFGFANVTLGSVTISIAVIALLRAHQATLS